MPRPRSDDKRAAIMSAATRVIAGQGLGAATAAIAKEAGVSNGSLFTYFDTKTDLFNQLYLELKAEMAALLERSRENGAMRDSPLPFVLALANSLAEATIDFVIGDPGHADARSRAAFDALWRMIA